MRHGAKAAVGAAGLLLAASAHAQGYNPGHLAPTDQAQLAGICTSVIGLSHGNRQFDACMEGLSSSLREKASGGSLSQARADCLQTGAAPGGAALARCELADARAAQATRPPAILPVRAPLAGRPPSPYWMASNADIHQREQTGCADLGLEPVGQAFARCVAGLDSRLFNANNPSQ